MNILLKIFLISFFLRTALCSFAEEPASGQVNEASVCSVENQKKLKELVDIYEVQLPQLTAWKERTKTSKDTRIEAFKETLQKQNITTPSLEALIAQLQKTIDEVYAMNVKVIELKSEIIDFSKKSNWQKACPSDQILKIVLTNLVDIETLNYESAAGTDQMDILENQILVELSKAVANPPSKVVSVPLPTPAANLSSSSEPPSISAPKIPDTSPNGPLAVQNKDSR